MYPLQLNPDTKRISTLLERERALGHGKKPVTDIIVLDDVGIILTLCGTLIQISLKTEKRELNNFLHFFEFLGFIDIIQYSNPIINMHPRLLQ